MITCMGLFVGIVDSANPHDVVVQCADFIRKYKYLRSMNPMFQIDETDYVVLKDWDDTENVGLFEYVLDSTRKFGSHDVA